MADENMEEVKLSPEDIPGAAVEDDEIGKLTVKQLKFWLKCRRITKVEINRLFTKGSLRKVVASSFEEACC
jgi:hypothetical protein